MSLTNNLRQGVFGLSPQGTGIPLGSRPSTRTFRTYQL